MNKKLWDFTCNNAADDIEGGGWMSSYSRTKFSKLEMDEYIQNVTAKLLPYLDKTKKILEIGCSSGLTMYALAPYIKEYVALDMSSRMIAKNNEKISQKSIKNIQLYCLYAHELDCINQDKFDIGIINSVIHCFEGHLYFKRVFRKLINKMDDSGVIFLGDIMDADKKDEFERSLIDYRMTHDKKTKVDLSQELFLSKEFIEDLSFDFPEICNIEISDKYHTLENELTKYRYDVIIFLNKKLNKIKDKERNKYQYSCNIFHKETL